MGEQKDRNGIIEQIRIELGQVIDPELGVNIVDLGLIFDVGFDNGEAHVVMTLTTPGCPMHDMMVGAVKHALSVIPDVRTVQVEVVWEPRWTPAMMSDRARDQLDGGF